MKQRHSYFPSFISSTVNRIVPSSSVHAHTCTNTGSPGHSYFPARDERSGWQHHCVVQHCPRTASRHPHVHARLLLDPCRPKRQRNPPGYLCMRLRGSRENLGFIKNLHRLIFHPNSFPHTSKSIYLHHARTHGLFVSHVKIVVHVRVQH